MITSQKLKPWSHHIHCHENELRSLKKPPKQITFQGTASLSQHGTGHSEKENVASFTSKFVSETCLQKPENLFRLTGKYRAAHPLFRTQNLDCYPQVNISHPLNKCHCSDS